MPDPVSPGRSSTRLGGRGGSLTYPSAPLSSAERARLPLVDLIMREALDEEYADVARRRGGVARRRTPGAAAAVAVLLFAVLVTVSFQQTRNNEDVVDAGRATLENRIVARREVVSSLQDRIVALRAENTAAEAALDGLAASAADSSRRLAQLEDSTGFSTVSGEGVRYEVGDSPDGLAKHRVYDEDLTLLTNGLWGAGATAIAVNGQRLTALSAFRVSGSTIRVNSTNLVPPYTVDVLGDRATLQANLLDTTTGLAFRSRADEFGFVLKVQNEQRLTLPPAPDKLLDLRSARAGSSQDQDPPSGRD